MALATGCGCAADDVPADPIGACFTSVSMYRDGPTTGVAYELRPGASEDDAAEEGDGGLEVVAPTLSRRRRLMASTIRRRRTLASRGPTLDTEAMGGTGRIKLTCACGYVIRVSPRYAGKKGKCPGCQGTVRIPALEVDLDEPEPKTKLVPPPAKPGKESRDAAAARAASEAPTQRFKLGSAGAKSRGPDLGLPAAVSRDPPKAAKPPVGPKRVHGLVRLGAEPIRLVVGAPMVIGRSEQCDLTIPSPRVSRRHCQLGWRGDRPYLKDLGSQNGTLVNGKRIHEHQLEDKDEIVVGPFLITYLCPDDPAQLADALDVIVDGDMKTEFTPVDAMAGRIEEVTLFEVLQTLEFTKKKGTLEVHGKGGSSAQLGVDGGAVVFARLGDLRGLDAVWSLLEWDKGTFAFKPELARTPDIRTPITAVLLEAGRRMDEKGG